MQRRSRCPCSRERLHVGAHHVRNPADFRRLPKIVHRRLPLPHRLAQRLDGEIRPYPALEFEAVGHRFCRAIDADFAVLKHRSVMPNAKDSGEKRTARTGG